MKLFPVSVLSADQMIYQGNVYSLNVPAGLGDMGILADHVPLISFLTIGKIAIKKNPQDVPQILDVKEGGFLEISRKGVTLLLKTGTR